MGRRLDDYSPVTIDVSKLPGRRLTDEEVAALVRAVKVEEVHSAEAWGRALAKVGMALGKAFAAGA